jgi:antitoxin HicB
MQSMTRKNNRPMVTLGAEEEKAVAAMETEVKRSVVDQIIEALDEREMTRTLMAEHMNTSRGQLQRVMNPNNPALTLNTLVRAAYVLGKIVTIQFHDAPDLDENNGAGRANQK